MNNSEESYKNELKKAKEKEESLEKKIMENKQAPCQLCKSHEKSMTELNAEFKNLQDKMTKTEDLYQKLLQEQKKEDCLEK